MNNFLHCIWVNNRFYLLKNNIEVYDNNLNFIEAIKTNIEYNAITYNDEEKKFYLSTKSNNIYLYKSYNFNSFKLMKINLPINCFEEIKHLSFCKCKNSILITTKRNIFIYNLCNKHFKIKYGDKDIDKTNDCIGPLNCDPSIILIGAVCCCRDIFVAYRIGKNSYISNLVKGRLDDIYYKTKEFIKSIFIVRDEIWIMVINENQPEFINTKIKCSCNETKNSKCQIISSIASVEKSLAKILESESFKINNAVDKAESINELICINSSVKETIYYITVLEFILTEKLKVINKKKDC